MTIPHLNTFRASIMTSSQAIRFVTSSSKCFMGSIHLQCHVKPGASKLREGVLSISDEVLDLCVAAPAREGEANKAVRYLISTVRVFLQCPLCRFTNAMTRFSKCPKQVWKLSKGINHSIKQSRLQVSVRTRMERAALCVSGSKYKSL
jgi:hypothetical protein